MFKIDKKCPKTTLDFGLFSTKKGPTSPQYGTPKSDFENVQLPAHMGPPTIRTDPPKVVFGHFGPKIPILNNTVGY